MGAVPASDRRYAERFRASGTLRGFQRLDANLLGELRLQRRERELPARGLEAAAEREGHGGNAVDVEHTRQARGIRGGGLEPEVGAAQVQAAQTTARPGGEIADTGIEVDLLKSQDAGTMLSKAILTAGNPEGDVMWGVDNTLLSRAIEQRVFDDYKSSAAADLDPRFTDLVPNGEATPVDYGDVCVNYDIAAMQAAAWVSAALAVATAVICATAMRRGPAGTAARSSARS